MRQNRLSPPIWSQPQPEPQPPPSRQELLRKRLRRLYTRFHDILLIVVVIFIVTTAVLVYNATRPPPQHLTQRDINTAVERALSTAKPKPTYASQAYEVIRPSVVGISALGKTTDDKTEVASGTGVVIEEGGTILTSLHVVRDALEIGVVFADGTESEAVIIGAWPENDLAVLHPLQIPDDLVPATLTSSQTLHVGDEVIAVGNPFGISNSLSDGVVSGLGRNFKVHKTGEILTNLIQFDTAVNPGNSGGPLINRDGEVVGIVTGLLNPTDQDFFIGIGFAVPIETAAGMAGAPPL